MDHRQIRMLHPFNVCAGPAGAAGLPRSEWLRAVQCLGQPERQGPAPHPLRPGKKIGVADRLVAKVFFQQLDGPFVAEHFPVHAGSFNLIFWKTVNNCCGKAYLAINRKGIWFTIFYPGKRGNGPTPGSRSHGLYNTFPLS
jgi:hypothetical protein